MFRTLALTALLAPLPALAQEQAEDAITGVISRQLDAFNARDIGAAWAFASPGIKRMFGSPENFGRMVREGYPMVWDNADARFLGAEEIGGSLFQKVMVRGPDGQIWVLGYEMIELDGAWKINGVAILPAPDVGV